MLDQGLVINWIGFLTPNKWWYFVGFRHKVYYGLFIVCLITTWALYGLNLLRFELALLFTGVALFAQSLMVQELLSKPRVFPTHLDYAPKLGTQQKDIYFENPMREPIYD